MHETGQRRSGAIFPSSRSIYHFSFDDYQSVGERSLMFPSYDANLRIFDTRSPGRPLSTVETGGGIWRSRFHPSPERANDILVASMHDGFKVVRLPPALFGMADSWKAAPHEGSESAERAGEADEEGVVMRFDGHESLAYGADWSRAEDGGGGTLVGSCSFYDHLMHIWRA